MKMFQATVKFIGWLSGSLAGIGALLSFFGYLATAAHLKLLGLDITLFGFGAEYYLQRGGNFLFYVVDTFGQRIFLPLMVIGLIPLTVFLAVDLFPDDGRLRQWLKSQKEKFLASCSRQATRLRTIATLILILLLFLQLGPSLDNLINPLKISDLLYRVNNADTATNDCLVQVLVDQRREILAKKFFFLIFEMFRAGLYLLIVWYITENIRYRLIINIPFVMIFALYLIFLPMNYGVMRIKSEFPVLTLTDKKIEKSPQQSYFLLSKSDKAFVLWDAPNQKIIWLPTSKVGSVVIGRNQPLWPKNKQSELTCKI